MVNLRVKDLGSLSNFSERKCAGNINLDSINENSKATITTQANPANKRPVSDGKRVIGSSAATVVNTPKIVGNATRSVPLMVDSKEMPCFSL